MARTRRVKRAKRTRSKQRGGVGMTDGEFLKRMKTISRIKPSFKDTYDTLYGIINSYEYNAKKHIPEGYVMLYAYALAFLSGNKNKASEISLKAEEIKREVEDSIQMGIAANKRNENNAAWLDDRENNNNNNTKFRKEWEHGPAFMGRVNKRNYL